MSLLKGTPNYRSPRMETENSDAIRHFRHPHPLIPTKFNQRERRCGMCKLEINSEASVYCCERCNFFLHKLCAEFKEQIVHPFHPQHPLLYLEESPYIEDFICDACGDTFRTCIYHCEDPECDFDLDLGCAVLMSSTNKYADLLETLQKRHQHPLFVCEKPKDFDYLCTRCCEEIEKDDLIFVCLTCNELLDEPCAALGNETRHPLHHEHLLTLQPLESESSPNCSVCSAPCDTSFFRCSSCGFILDIDCANLKPTANSNPDEGHIQIQPVSHPHALIQCDGIKDFGSRCYGCGLSFHNLIYSCLSCGILLHRSCADLPNKIVHPFHPKHTLFLEDNCKESIGSPCRVCCKASGFFIYGCRECEFGLDIKCARLGLRIMTEAHEHALAYINIRTFKFKCSICGLDCREYFFRCLDCKFNIHDHCYPSLPHTIKDDCHSDPLTFTTNPIKDMPDEEADAEFYCHACEETRDLNHPTYFCAGCHFVAHVHCVLQTIIPYIRRTKALADCSTTLGVTKDDESTSGGASAAMDIDLDVNKIEEEIATVTEKMDALAVTLEELEDKRNVLYKQHKLQKKIDQGVREQMS